MLSGTAASSGIVNQLMHPMSRRDLQCSNRTYDADHDDYHTWDDSETVYYRRWETENHYDHKDFEVRSKEEQKQYFDWRHKH